MVFEKIQVQLELLTDKFTKPMQKAERSMKDLNKQAFKQGAAMREMSSKSRVATEQITQFRNQNMRFGQVMNMSMENFKSFNQQGFRFTTIGGRMAAGIRTLTHGMRGFRMEALGVMFFGMSMAAMFKGLLQPVMEAFGVFDLFRLMLLVLFLPIMEMLFPVLLSLMNWFINLPGPVKKVLGIFAILGVIFGTIFFVVGTLILGIGSLILMWPVLAGVATAAVAAVAAVFWPVIAIIAIVIAIVIGMRLAWKQNFLGMKKIVSNFISGVKDFFSAMVKFFRGIFLIIKGIFLGDWKLIWEGVRMIFMAAVQSVWGIIKMLVNGIGAILVGLIKIVFNIVKGIVGFFINMPGQIWNAIKGIGKMIKKAFTAGIPDWIIDIMKKGIDFVGDIFGGSSKKSAKREDDFIWRPGQGSVSINPNDTLVGFKGAPPNLGGDSGSAGNTTNNFYGFTMEELKKELDDRDRKMVSQMERNR